MKTKTAKVERTETDQAKDGGSAFTPAAGSTISDSELNQLLHDTLLDELLDEMGAPKEHCGGKLSPFGRLRRIAPALLADKKRMDFLVGHTHYEFWVHHPNYDALGGKRFNSEGVVAREVIDSAIQWLSSNTKGS